MKDLDEVALEIMEEWWADKRECSCEPQAKAYLQIKIKEVLECGILIGLEAYSE